MHAIFRARLRGVLALDSARQGSTSSSPRARVAESGLSLRSVTIDVAKKKKVEGHGERLCRPMIPRSMSMSIVYPRISSDTRNHFEYDTVHYFSEGRNILR